MFKVRIIVVEEVMRTVGTMREAMRRHMREGTSSEEIVWSVRSCCWVIHCLVHNVSWERHAAHVDNRAMAHAKEWIMGTTVLLRHLRSSSLHAICHSLLHVLLDLLLHHMLDKFWLERAVTLDSDLLIARSIMNMLLDMMSFIVSQELIVVATIQMLRRMLKNM